MKYNIVLKKIMCSLLVIMLSFIMSVNIYAATYSVSIAKKSQEKTNWCWAACSQMIGSYYSRAFSQSSICTRVKGKVENKAATISEITTALKYTSNKSVAQSGVTSFSTLRNSLKAKVPAVIRMGWNSGGGHVYVLSGVKEASGAQVNSVYLIDPIAGKASGYFGYSKLVNGMTLASGTGKYTHTWRV